VSLLVAASLLAGCATGDGASRVTAPRAGEAAASPPRRCSPADPDRWAWFCVIGRLFYETAAAFQPPSERTR
jgi:hypothetical protein